MACTPLNAVGVRWNLVEVDLEASRVSRLRVRSQALEEAATHEHVNPQHTLGLSLVVKSDIAPDSIPERRFASAQVLVAKPLFLLLRQGMAIPHVNGVEDVEDG